MLLSLKRPALLAVLALVAALLVAAVPGAGPVAAEPVGEVDGVQVNRFGGPNRIDTAVEVSQATFETATAVVVARADTYADALVGAPLAAALDAPILLNAVDEVSPQVAAEIARLGATEVYLLGGTEALTTEVEAGFAEDAEVTRVDGGNRFATAANIARQLDETQTVFIARGGAETITAGFPDPLSASYYAAFLGAPILLAVDDDLPDETAAVIEEFNPAEVVIVGGTDAVNADVEAELSAGGSREVRRLAGADRYETSAEVYDEAVTRGVDPSTKWLARGDLFADALAAGPAVADEGEALLLVDGDDLTAETATASRIQVSQDLLTEINLLGLEHAINANAVDQLEALLTEELAPADYCLTVLHNNDGESQLLSDGPFGGIARFGSLVDREKARALEGTPDDGCAERAVLTVSSGDNFLAGPEFSASLDKGVPFYDTIALEAIGYDAFAIGNHEFDFGPDVLADFIRGFEEPAAPFVSANLDVTAETSLAQLADEGRIVPSTIIEAGSRQVGVVGLTTPDLPDVSSPESVTVSSALAEAVATEVDSLQADGADAIVLISHLQGIEEEINLVPVLSDVDIVVGGGGDEVLASEGEVLVPGDENAVFGPYPLPVEDADGDVVPVVTSPGDYLYLGRLVARFGADGLLGDGEGVDPEWSKIVRVADEDLPDGVTEDPELVEQVVEPVSAYVEELDETVIATSQVPLDGTRENVRSRETNLGDLVADSQVDVVEENLAPQQPIVGIQNGGGIRNTEVIPAGPITLLDTFDTAPFANFIGAVPDIEPAELEALLEHGYAVVETGGGQFAQISGMEVVVDLSQPARTTDEEGAVTEEGSRVVSVTLDDGTPIVVDGEPVPASPATTVTVATSDFLARGGDAYPFPEGAFISAGGVPYQEALEQFLVEDLGGVVTAADYPVGGEGRITFTE